MRTAELKSIKCLYSDVFNRPFNTIGPVYSKKVLNSVAFQYSTSSNVLGKRLNSDGKKDLILTNSCDTSSGFISQTGYLPLVQKTINFLTTPRHMLCMYSSTTVDVIFMGNSSNGLTSL